MRCIDCRSGSEGFAVIPGIGALGEIRFYCDPCARKSRVKMRYWDGRDLDVGGYRESPDLGASFGTLIFSFDDLARLRREDLEDLLEWVADEELASAMQHSSTELHHRVYEAAGPARSRRIRDLLPPKGSPALDPEAAQDAIIRTVRRL